MNNVQAYINETATTHFVFVYRERGNNDNTRVFASIVPVSEIEPFFRLENTSGSHGKQQKPRFKATISVKHQLENKYGRIYLCTLKELNDAVSSVREMVTCKPSKINRGHGAEYVLCKMWNAEFHTELDTPHTVSGDISINGYEYQVKYEGGWL